MDKLPKLKLPETLSAKKGWSHEEAKQHSLVERLEERCQFFAVDSLSCRQKATGMGRPEFEDWCERCLAAWYIEIMADGRSPLDWRP